MAGDTIITWNWPNWITVGLMALIFLAAIAFGANLWSKKTAGAAT